MWGPRREQEGKRSQPAVPGSLPVIQPPANRAGGLQVWCQPRLTGRILSFAFFQLTFTALKQTHPGKGWELVWWWRRVPWCHSDLSSAHSWGSRCHDAKVQPPTGICLSRPSSGFCSQEPFLSTSHKLSRNQDIHVFQSWNSAVIKFLKGCEVKFSCTKIHLIQGKWICSFWVLNTYNTKLRTVWAEFLLTTWLKTWGQGQVQRRKYTWKNLLAGLKIE